MNYENTYTIFNGVDSSSSLFSELIDVKEKTSRGFYLLPAFIIMSMTTSVDYKNYVETVPHCSLHSIEYTLKASSSIDYLNTFKQFVAKVVNESIELEPEFSTIIRNHISELLW
jgi:predicted neutral ceramidase superfamily lipid hydrolase